MMFSLCKKSFLAFAALLLFSNEICATRLPAPAPQQQEMIAQMQMPPNQVKPFWLAMADSLGRSLVGGQKRCLQACVRACIRSGAAIASCLRSDRDEDEQA